MRRSGVVRSAKMFEKMGDLVRRIQEEICADVSSLDGAPFREDRWERSGGGGGVSRVLQEGRVFEKAGVNTSEVVGTLSREAARAMGGGRQAGECDLAFRAVGLSVVIHPHNPMAPTAHCNYRYFERGEGAEPKAWWFGGGSDLTPAYLFDEDAHRFHQVLREACDRHDPAYYPRFKRWCDDYFFLPHRGEARGIGGIFFDDLCDGRPEPLFDFVRDCAESFIPSYLPLVRRRKDMAFTEENKRWQALRRGRYVEFNLLYDRGTTFGLKTGGRVESILMSLPLTARWEYAIEPEVGSEEDRLLNVLRFPREWT
jgi:coproporphyrinogen III oxidase